MVALGSRIEHEVVVGSCMVLVVVALGSGALNIEADYCYYYHNDDFG